MKVEKLDESRVNDVLEEAYIDADDSVLKIIRSDREYNSPAHTKGYEPDFSQIPDGTVIKLKRLNPWHPQVQATIEKISENNWEYTYSWGDGSWTKTLDNHGVMREIQDVDTGCYESLQESYLKVDKFGYELIDQLGYSGCVRYGTGLEDGRVYADDVTLKQIQNELGNKCGQNYDIIEESINEDSQGGSSITAYRANPTAMCQYREIPNGADLGIHCGSKFAAYIMSINGKNEDSFTDRITFSPKKILQSEDPGDWSIMDTPMSFRLPNDVRLQLTSEIRDLSRQEASDKLRSLLLDMGYDCIQYKNEAEDVGSISYVILDPHIIDNVYNNCVLSFFEFFGDYIYDVENLSENQESVLGKIALFRNGLSDVALAKVTEINRVEDKRSTNLFEVVGEVDVSLDKHFHFRKGSSTNTYVHNHITLVKEIPEKLLKALYEGYSMKKSNLTEALSQEEVGASALFNDLIQREYEQLNQYDSIQVTLEDKDDSRFSDVLEYIKDDINIHIGMLQACLQDLNGSEEQVEQGEDQATQLTLSESLFKEDYQVQALGDPIYAYLSTTEMAMWTTALMSYDEEKVKSNSQKFINFCTGYDPDDPDHDRWEDGWEEKEEEQFKSFYADGLFLGSDESGSPYGQYPIYDIYEYNSDFDDNELGDLFGFKDGDWYAEIDGVIHPMVIVGHHSERY